MITNLLHIVTSFPISLTNHKRKRKVLRLYLYFEMIMILIFLVMVPQYILYKQMLTEILIILIIVYVLLSLLFYFFPLLIHERIKHSNPFFNLLLNSKSIVCLAHRGGAYEGPENTIETFKQSKGVCHVLEMDVLITKDKQLVVCHDPNIERLCGVNKELKSYDFKELPTLQR